MAEQMQIETFEFEKRKPIKGYPELHWTGKRPYESTQYFPAQLRERYGTEQDGWINKIFWGDNLQVMSHMLKEYRGKIDLIYIDPPFDSKADYKKKIEIKGIGKAESDNTSFEEKQYGDIWTNDEYFQGEIVIPNYYKEPLNQVDVLWQVSCKDKVLFADTLNVSFIPQGEVISCGQIRVPLNRLEKAVKLQVELKAPSLSVSNKYDVWVYPSSLQENKGNVQFAFALPCY